MTKIQWQTQLNNTVFVIQCSFKLVAIFKPSSWRNDNIEYYPYIIWYSLCDDKGDRDKMIRIGGNVWRYECIVKNSSFKYTKK